MRTQLRRRAVARRRSGCLTGYPRACLPARLAPARRPRPTAARPQRRPPGVRAQDTVGLHVHLNSRKVPRAAHPPDTQPSLPRCVCHACSARARRHGRCAGPALVLSLDHLETNEERKKRKGKKPRTPCRGTAHRASAAAAGGSARPEPRPQPCPQRRRRRRCCWRPSPAAAAGPRHRPPPPPPPCACGAA
jgi:hypothetical protein